jgi:hypothetical protein
MRSRGAWSDRWLVGAAAAIVFRASPAVAGAPGERKDISPVPSDTEGVAAIVVGSDEAPVAMGEIPHEPAAIRPGSGPARNDVARARLLNDAERIANSITWDHPKALALSHVAKSLAGTAPEPAARLFTNAECVADSITHAGSKASALRDVVEAMAATDPGRAERIANSIADELDKASALSHPASGFAATDPIQAARFLTDAERIVNSFTPDKRTAMADEDTRHGHCVT